MKKCEESFLESYRENLPPDGVIPYRYLSCFKESEEGGVFLVSLPGENEYAILKVGQEAVAREYSLLQKVQDLPGVCVPRAMACWQEGDRQYLLRQYIPGYTLSQWRDEKEHVTTSEIIDLGLKVCHALQSLHEAGWIVRDVKPDNLVYTDDHRIVLIDVDTIRRPVPSQQQDTQYLGTPGYAAPEQYGFGQTSEQTDIYGLGQLLTFLAVGEPDATSTAQSKLPWQIRHIIRRCTALQPKKRYANAARVAAALKRTRCMPRVALALAGLLLCAVIGLSFVGAPQKVNYATLQEAINAVPEWTSATIQIDRNWTLTEPLVIAKRQITLEGNGVIKDSAFEETALVSVAHHGKLILGDGVSLHGNHGHDVVDNQGVFELDGGTIHVWSGDGEGKLFYNGVNGKTTIRRGEMHLSSTEEYDKWSAANDGALHIEGGLIQFNSRRSGILNTGKAELQGGVIAMYVENDAVALPLHQHQQGYAHGDGTMFQVNNKQFER